jgi:hypothetical protein
MGGNVREWCWNESQYGRCIRGGAWDDFSYTVRNISNAFPMDRIPQNGFRCIRYLDLKTIPESVFNPVKLSHIPDYLSEQPISDSAFELIRGRFDYDKGDLNARLRIETRLRRIGSRRPSVSMPPMEMSAFWLTYGYQ